MSGLLNWLSEHLSDTTKHVMDALSISVLVGTLSQMLPAVAAGLSIIWTLIRIWETRSVQKLIGRDPTSEAIKKLYHNTLKEPVPDELNDLLKKLK